MQQQCPASTQQAVEQASDGQFTSAAGAESQPSNSMSMPHAARNLVNLL
ncbi:MAG TPA: hypothetical protein VF762_21865 [Blastocatellia bacterium]